MRTTLLASCLVLAACKPTVPPPGAPPGVEVASITVTSKSFPSNGPIPIDYTCDGKDVSPQITWSAPPEGTKSLALLVDDPDAPSGTFTHWLVYNLPAETTSLAEGVDPATLGAKVGMNDFEQVRYGGPCPPKMQIHRYRFHLYALNADLDLPDGANRTKVDMTMNGHVLGEGTLYGQFSH
jgi:Raf kinase inhibitor-like YbhB/YbcL family protein